MVDKARFELATSSLRTKRSTGLIYLPISGDTAIDSKDIKSSDRRGPAHGTAHHQLAFGVPDLFFLMSSASWSTTNISTRNITLHPMMSKDLGMNCIITASITKCST